MMKKEEKTKQHMTNWRRKRINHQEKSPILLGVSSFPLHVIWNSTVFQIRISYDYLVISITEDVLHGANRTYPWSYMWPMEDWTIEDVNEVLRVLQSEVLDSKLERLDVNECIEKYHKEFLSNRRHVLLVEGPAISRY